MTWTKYGVEFFDQCAESGLSDAAVRTHAEALHYLSRLEDMDMRIKKHLVRRFAGSPDWEQAAKDLVTAEFWRDEGDAYVVVHHENVFRQSLAAQLSKRDTERERQRRKRSREPRDVGTNVDTNERPTQTDSLTDFQPDVVTRGNSRTAENESPDLTGDSPRCVWCKEPMTVYTPGQTMHPNCEPTLIEEATR